MASTLMDRDAALGEESPRPARLGNLLLMLPFLILFYIDLAHHQLWRDEINAWAIVVVSKSVRILLSNVHYEAHPALWYLTLYPASKISHAPVMMKLVESLVGTAIYLVIALAAPFKRAEQVLIYASFYVSFEYTVMSRMYGFMLLFALIYLWSRVKYPDRLAQNAFWLGMIANTDVTGMILSGGLLLEYGIDCWQRRKQTDSPGTGKVLLSLGIYCGMVALSAATLWPAKDISVRGSGPPLKHLHSIHHFVHAVINYLSLAWFPMRISLASFWEALAMEDLVMRIVLVPVVIASLYLVFRRQPRVLVMIGSIAVVGIAFFHLIFDGSVRHFGVVYVAFLGGIWILRGQKQFVSRVAYVLLGLNAIAGVAAAYGQWARPFTDDAATVAWIRQNHLENAAFIGTPDTGVVGVPERLERPIYFLDCGCWDTYMKFENRRDHYDSFQNLSSTLIKAVHDVHAPVMVLILNRWPTADEQAELVAGSVKLVPLAQFTKGELWDEHFFLFRVSAN